MKTATLLLASLLAGCATNWTKPGATQDDLYRDRYACQQQAAAMYPPQPVQVMTSPGFQPPPAPARTDCTMYGNQMTCQSAGGVHAMAVPPSYQTQDANADARWYAVRNCLLAKGYRQQ